MTSQKKFIFEVEAAKEATDGKPSIGPVYRSTFAKDGFPNSIDGIDSCWDIFRTAVEKYPNNRMLGRREIVNNKAGKYEWKTYKEVYDIVIKIGNSLRSCGIEQGGKCGIYGANCPEWIISMEACNAHGLYCVPFYDTLGSGAVEFIISHAEVSIAFVEEKKIPELFKTCPNSTKYMKTVVSFGGVKTEQKEEAEKLGLVIHAWDEFLKLGEGKQYDLPVKQKSDICTIMYTSGTTGDPKGVLLSNESIVTIAAGVMHFLAIFNESLTEKDVYISYLPLAHVFDRAVEECIIQVGGSIGFWRGVRTSQHSDLRNHLCICLLCLMFCVQDVKLLIEDLGELKPSIFCAVPRVLERVYTGLQQKLSVGGFFKKKVFSVAFSYKFGNMKKGQSHVEAAPFCDKLVFNKWQPDGSMKIIDRKKNIFKLAQGEYVAVENLENVYGQVEAIESIWVYGNSFESFLIAVANPAQQTLERWAEENGISGDFESICQNAKAKAFVLGELVKTAKERKLKGFEIIRAIHLEPVAFDIERDLLTPTYKKKRPQLLKYYQNVIDDMYKTAKEGQASGQ
ncbi:unnamed protein product [Eruca vesicaria subsp. sativa]|uniref:AMP-dependent synthetase/ligase domain-containing protein n=2 Tax=Eruca vesicaria subsp. sativa TaxID=29727 RepID=A0ABC8IZ42_ERUVS|nr:unnamed protein product [Eruca vesicaria subsp. sativa]